MIDEVALEVWACLAIVREQLLREHERAVRFLATGALASLRRFVRIGNAGLQLLAFGVFADRAAAFWAVHLSVRRSG